MACIQKYIGSEYFKSKTLLELGCGHGDNGHEFYKLGAIVTCSDARKEHIDVLKNKYPHLEASVVDCDNDNITDNYDIILHWGLLYHLNDIERHITNISQRCKVLLLETEVSDSDDTTFYIKTRESGCDQAFNCIGTRPSESYVEKILTNSGFNYKIINDSILNAEFHKYDWDIKNTRKWQHGLRRFWICWKNIETPISNI